MKISVAQIKPFIGDVSANIELHKKWISAAIDHNANAIFFPELSMTGYEPKLAKSLATTAGDKKFDLIQILCDQHNITIGYGMPGIVADGVTIDMIIHQPTQKRKYYSKQLLHEDQLPYFKPGKEQLIISIGDKKLAPAICYESLQPCHADSAYRSGIDIYLASVAKSKYGIEKGVKHYPAIAEKFSMPVLMSNSVGYCDNFESAGNSAVWTKSGLLAAQLDSINEGLLIYDTESEKAIII